MNSPSSTFIFQEFFDPNCPHQIFSLKFKVSEIELDSFGHVNNSNYLRYFEKARWDFINNNGYGLQKIQETQQGPVLLEVNVKFKKELKATDEIIIYSQVQKVESRFMTLKQIIVKENQKLSAEAIFLIGFFDLKSRKLIMPTPEWLLAVGFKS